MPAHRAKSTAQLTAFARAVAFLEPDPQLRAPDGMAVSFLDPPLAWATRRRLLRRLAVRVYDRKLPGAYLYTIARTKHIDMVLRRELEGGARQIVILGAGYDSRAYRFHGEFPAACFFEVDYPATSEAKLRKVTALLDRPPDHVRFVAVDLTVDTLEAALLGAGLHPGRQTLFIAEGLTMYLTAEAVDSLLACVAHRAGPGSSIIFDYVFRSILDGDSSLYGAVEAIRLVHERSEPFLFGIEAGTVGSFLGVRGLECVEELGPSEVERIYLSRTDGSVIGRSVGYWALAHARQRP
jgi:methyltransferase (TIGR00027 family)